MLHQEILATGEAKNLWLSYVVTVLDVYCSVTVLDSTGLQFVFGAKPEEVDRLRAERRQFQPPQEFHRIIG
jgi:hypothetical protein